MKKILLAAILISIFLVSVVISDSLFKNYTSLRLENGLADISIENNGYLVFKGPVHDDLRLTLSKQEGGSQIIYCHDMFFDCPSGCRGDNDLCILDRQGSLLYKTNLLTGNINRTRVDVKAGDKLSFKIEADPLWDVGLEIWKTEEICIDNDNDGYGTNCELGGDCNDGNANINPAGNDNNCNNIDENCDNVKDDGYVSTPTSCGVGVCAASGNLVCTNGVVTNTCNPGTPGAEVCGNGDEDCDGSVDEGCVITCSNNSDCGVNGFVGINFCSANNVYQDFLSFVCHFPGSFGSYCSNSTDWVLKQTCAYGCEAGACLPEPECVVNSDCGSAYYSDNYCLSGDVYKKLMSPICLSGNCSFESGEPNLVEDCLYGCSNGACLPEPISCFSNSDCNDNLYCNGQEKCIAGFCQAGIAINCSGNSLAEIATCNNNPDNNLFSFDYRAAFSSSCIEQTDSCSVSANIISHTFVIGKCGVECLNNNDCSSDEECENYKCEEKDEDEEDDDEDGRRKIINEELGQIFSGKPVKPIIGTSEDLIVFGKEEAKTNLWLWLLILLVILVVIILIILGLR